MTGPYGITQVDVPGALNALEVARSNRIRAMMLQRQIDQDERTADRENQFRSVLARAMGRGEDGKAGGVRGATEAYGAAPDAAAPATPPSLAAPAPPAAPAAPSQPAATALSPEVINELIAIDPEQGARIATAIRQMDEAQVERLGRAQEALARLGQHLLTQVPNEAEWAAEIQARAPDLIANGVSQEQIAGFVPNRRNVLYAISQARDIEKIIEDARPRLRNVGPGDTIIDERNPNGQPVYESPYVEGPGGELYQRPQSMRQSAQTPEQLRAAAEEAIRQGADPAQVNARLQQMLEGGAGQSAPRPFP